MIFDIDKTPPFLAFRKLREIAADSIGESNVLDLSQGEPGYGFSPSTISREMYAFLCIIDIELNNHFSNQPLMAHFTPGQDEVIKERIENTAKEHYSEEKAEKILKNFDLFIEKIQKATNSQGLEFSWFDVVYKMFRYSNVLGGRYPEPNGQILIQSVIAEEYTELLDTEVKYDELIPMLGASHGIGTVFKALGEEGIGYLHSGDYVLMTSPVYAPYNLMFKQRGINVLSLSIDPVTGEYNAEDIEAFATHKEKIKCIVLIDPNNPTGFASEEKFKKDILKIAEAHNSLIVTDEVYLRFFRGAKSLVTNPDIRKRTIRIDSLSKIERSTGLRVGDIWVSKDTNKFISQNILQSYLGDYKDLFDLLHLAKSPSGKNIGLFQHITGIPGPSVGMALCHLVLGREEREKTTDLVLQKMEIFYENIGLEYLGNVYYGMFDLRTLEHPEWKDKHVTEKLAAIAQKGIVLMPANLFFTEADREKKDRTHMARVSLPNLTLVDTQRAAQTIKEVMENPPV